MPLGFLASRVARDRAAAADTCFMRGVLLHVEHLVILGSVQQVSKDFRRTVMPTPVALHQAIARFAPEIRAAVAAAWSLDDLLIGGDDEARLAAEYASLRRALVCSWLKRPLPEVDGVDAETLARALETLQAPDAFATAMARSRGASAHKLTA